MNFNKYQNASRRTLLPSIKNLSESERQQYFLLGLGGEAGEVLEKFKKIIRDKNGVIDDDDAVKIAKELGDVLWYLARVCDVLEIEMDDVALLNIEKMKHRRDKNKIKGSGDER